MKISRFFVWVSFVVLAFTGCVQREAVRPPRPVAVKAPAVAPKSRTAPIAKHKARIRQGFTVANQGWSEPTEGLAMFFAGGAEDFSGRDRKAAKTSISAAAPDAPTTLKSLLSNLPATDDEMRNHHPPISKDASSNRISEEDRNVTVTAFLIAAKKESDHDYHVILGTKPGGQAGAKYMNVEVSGLPRASSADFAVLQQAREEFKDSIDGDLGSAYTFFETARVRVSGSLFYDIDHAPGIVGPEGFRPDTAWEIHPITSFEIVD